MMLKCKREAGSRRQRKARTARGTLACRERSGLSNDRPDRYVLKTLLSATMMASVLAYLAGRADVNMVLVPPAIARF